MIQIAKKQLKMDDDIYRANLKAWVGVDSTTKMNDTQLKAVIKGMEKLGFKKQKAPRRNIDQALLDNNPQLKKLGQLWTMMHAQGLIENGSYIALEKWCKSQSKSLNDGKEVDCFEWMLGIAQPLIERLKGYHLRLMKKALEVKSLVVLHHYKRLDVDSLSDADHMFVVQTKLAASRLSMAQYLKRERYESTLKAFVDCELFIKKYGENADAVKGGNNAKAS